MRIWNNEVSCCNMCGYNYYDGLIGHLRCNLSKKLILGNRYNGSVEPVHEDCPFSEQVDKEAVDKFGFKYDSTEAYSEDKYFQFVINDVKLYGDGESSEAKISYLGISSYGKIYKIKIYNSGYDDWYTVFEGVINNSIELEFILKSTGIIKQ